MEFDDYETTEALFTCLESLQTEAKMILKEKGKVYNKTGAIM
jgi:hypothetical protein